MEKIKKIEIHNKIFDETYTAHIQRNGPNWLGWIPEVPKVKCEEPTEAEAQITTYFESHQSPESFV